MTKFAPDKLPKAVQEYLFKSLKTLDLRPFMFWYVPNSGRLFWERHIPPLMSSRGGTPGAVASGHLTDSIEIPQHFRAECERVQAEADD